MVGRVSRRVVERALLVIFAVPLLVALAVTAYDSTLFYARNYNEGWNAYMIAAAASGKPIYFPPAALFTNNYPPLSFYIIGLVSRVAGDALFVGRAVAWLAYLSVAGGIFAILRRLGDDAVAAWFGALLFAGSLAIITTDYIGLNDPQMLAHAVSIFGLFLYVGRRERESASAVLAVVISCALFIKHNIVALPLALVIWFCLYDRRAALRFAATGIVCAVLGSAACWAIFGSDFFFGLLAARQFSLVTAYRTVIPLIALFQLPLALSGLAVVLDRSDRYSVLFALYAAASLLIGSAVAGGVAVSENCLFEVLIAMALASGHLVGRLQASPSDYLGGLRSGLIGACGVACLLSAALKTRADAVLVVPWIENERAAEAATLEAVRRLAETPGPALCENLAICYWAKKPIEADLFNFGQGALAGTKPLNLLEARIASGTYAGGQFFSLQSAPSVIRALRAAFAARYREISLPQIGDLYLRAD